MAKYGYQHLTSVKAVTIKFAAIREKISLHKIQTFLAQTEPFWLIF